MTEPAFNTDPKEIFLGQVVRWLRTGERPASPELFLRAPPTDDVAEEYREEKKRLLAKFRKGDLTAKGCLYGAKVFRVNNDGGVEGRWFRTKGDGWARWAERQYRSPLPRKKDWVGQEFKDILQGWWQPKGVDWQASTLTYPMEHWVTSEEWKAGLENMVEGDPDLVRIPMVLVMAKTVDVEKAFELSSR
ncbi:hypothetical protein ACFL12_05820 [Pseudomonadota bacterium]